MLQIMGRLKEILSVREVAIFLSFYVILLRSTAQTMKTFDTYTSNMDGLGQQYQYLREGDVNLGAVFSIHEYDEIHKCGRRLRDSGVVQHAEAMVYAIDQINRDPHLLPDVNLGFVIFDDCLKPTTALAQVLHFMPRHSSDTKLCSEVCRDELESFHQVIGVIGAESSRSSIMMANILTIFQIPQISHTSTSDLLSDKNKYPYFMRLIPPDRFQVQAIIHILLHFQWTHVSVVYTAGGYGQKATEKLITLAAKNNICLGTSIPVTVGQVYSSFHQVIDTLLENKATVVVLFMDQEEALGVLTAAKSMQVTHFTWIGSDGLGVNIDDLDGVADIVQGALVLKQYSVPVNDFENYFVNLSPNDNANPWLEQLWTHIFHCSWHTTNITHHCNQYKHINQSADYSLEPTVPNIIDIVYTFARALQDLITQNCPNISRHDVNDCVKSNNYLEYLRKVHFTGLTGEVRFDEYGDVLGTYEIVNTKRSQGDKIITQQVGHWDAKTKKLIINGSIIEWNTKDAQTIPKSKCAEDCTVGEIYSYFKNTCCWECRSCNRNEITVENATKCETCPLYQWPDEKSMNVCIPITPDHVRWYQPILLVLDGLATAGLCATVIIFLTFLYNNDARIIKATSRELSYIMLTGVFVQYVLVLTAAFKPGTCICYLNYIGFNTSFTIVYGALLTRTNRIYRIFKAGKRSKIRPSLTSPLSQVLITIGLTSIQVLINLVVVMFHPTGVRKQQPLALENYVELICDLNERGFICSLCYNLILIVICTFYAFKTRSLPDNFNESRCISLCVYTTSIIWMAFLPTYFTTPLAFYKVVLISSALLLNSTVTMLCLFVPKLYGLKCDFRRKMVDEPGKKPGEPCQGTSLISIAGTTLNGNAATLGSIEDFSSK